MSMLLVAGLAAHAQRYATLTIQVTPEEPLADAVADITIEHLGPPPAQRAEANADGRASVELRPGRYMVTVRYSGHCSELGLVSLKRGDTRTLDFELERIRHRTFCPAYQLHIPQVRWPVGLSGDHGFVLEQETLQRLPVR